MFESIILPPNYKLRLASQKDIPSIQCLDDLVFLPQKGISDQEIRKLLEFGAIILLFDPDDILVGESQVLLQDMEIVRPITLSESDVYYYGTAVHPKEQGQGLGKILALAQDEIANTKRKQLAVATVRAENYPSLKLRLSTGFRIVGFNPTFYGSAIENGARTIIHKRLSGVLTDPDKTACVNIKFGEEPDIRAQNEILFLIENEFQGFKVSGSKDGIGKIYFGK